MMGNGLCGRLIISHMLICFSTQLYYDIISLKIIQAFYLLLGYEENQGIFWDFKIKNGVRITEGSDNGDSDNGDSDNQGSTVHHCSGTMVRTQQAIGELLHLVI